MNTRKSISTISYNTKSFLKHTLDRLVNDCIISFYAFIYHKGEADELKPDGTPKDHIHLFIKPNRTLDTMVLGKEFIEVVPDNDKPLKCIDWRCSSPDDAILYFLHNEDYLKAKLQSRYYHYELSDFVTSDTDELEYLYQHALLSDVMQIKRYSDLFKDNSLAQLCAKGFIVPRNAVVLETYEKLVRKGQSQLGLNFHDESERKYFIDD